VLSFGSGAVNDKSICLSVCCWIFKLIQPQTCADDIISTRFLKN
jgi:hypothetical protein